MGNSPSPLFIELPDTKRLNLLHININKHFKSQWTKHATISGDFQTPVRRSHLPAAPSWCLAARPPPHRTPGRPIGAQILYGLDCNTFPLLSLRGAKTHWRFSSQKWTASCHKYLPTIAVWRSDRCSG